MKQNVKEEKSKDSMDFQPEEEIGNTQRTEGKEVAEKGTSLQAHH